jgi:hypothetical protein
MVGVGWLVFVVLSCLLFYFLQRGLKHGRFICNPAIKYWWYMQMIFKWVSLNLFQIHVLFEMTYKNNKSKTVRVDFDLDVSMWSDRVFFGRFF